MKLSARLNWRSTSLFVFWCSILGAVGEFFDDRKSEAAMTSVEHLRAFAKPLGVRILLGKYP